MIIGFPDVRISNTAREVWALGTAGHVLETARRLAAETQVVVLAGGKGKRMGNVEVPKPLIPVCGRPLIDRCIDYFKGCGFREFVVLVGHGGDKIVKHLGDGSRFGVSIRYSWDPPVGRVGKGKAIKHAIEQGVIDVRRRAIIAFPDDIYLDPNLPLRLLLHHLSGVRLKGIKATIVVVSAIRYPYGVVEVDVDGRAREFVEKPVLRIRTSTGLYVLEPEVLELTRELIDIDAPRAVEFEEVVLPELARRGWLYVMEVPEGVWVPVNTLKDLEEAERRLREFEAGQ